MGRKERSILAMSGAMIILLFLVLLTILLPAGASGGLDGQGVKWRSYDLYRTPLGVDADGNVYAMTDTPGDPTTIYNPTLVSLDVNGTKRWAYQVRGFGQSCIVDVDGRTYLLESVAANTYEFRKETILAVIDQDGGKNLTVDLASRHNDSAVLKLLHASNNVLYYAANGASPDSGTELCAIGLNGTELWSAELLGTVFSVSPMSGSSAVLATTVKGVYIIDSDGSIVRSMEVADGWVLTAPSISPNGTMYLAVHHGDVYLPNEVWAMGPEWNKLWAQSLIPEVTYAMDCMVVDILLSNDGTLFVATTGGTETGVPSTSYDPYNSTKTEYSWIPPRLLALDQNGQITWSHILEESARGPLAEMDDRIVVCASNGILVFSPDGTLADRYSPPSGFLASMVMTDEGNFYFVEVISPNVALGFSDGLPRVTIVDWLLAYKMVVVLVSIAAALSVIGLMLYRRRRRRSG